MSLLALLPVVIASFLSQLEARFVFTGAYFASPIHSDPGDHGQPFETVRIPTDDGLMLSAWLMPNSASELWLLYLHGQGGNISGYLPVTTRLARHYNVLSIDYRGYGESEGVPSEAGLYEDALASYRFLLGRGVSPERIVPYGFSLGSGVAVDLASRVEVGALVAEAAYTSLKDAARAIYRVPAPLVRQSFDSAAKLPLVDAPVALLHASDDRTIPVQQGKALFALARGPKTFITLRGGHIAMLEHPQTEALETLKAFLEAHTGNAHTDNAHTGKARPDQATPTRQ